MSHWEWEPIFFVNESVWHDSVITTSWVAEWIFAYERKSAKLKRYFATSQELSSALILVQISKYWCSCVFYRSSRKKYFVFLCKYWQRKTWWWHRKFTSSQQEHKEGRIVKTKQKQQLQQPSKHYKNNLIKIQKTETKGNFGWDSSGTSILVRLYKRNG